MMESVLDLKTILLLIVASSFIAFAYISSFKQDSREPPLIPSSIPFIGHLLGLIKHGSKYYPSLSAKHLFPIYKLKMLGADTIIVNSPELTTAVQRNSKAMSFGPLVTDFSIRVTRPSKIACDILLKNMNGEDGKESFLKDITKAMHGALAVGADLDRMNESMVESLSRQIENLDLLAQSGPIGFFEWTRRCITLASTNAAYGPKNPFKDLAVEQAFWEFDRNTAMIFLNFMPYLTARKSHNARRKVQASFIDYFKSKGYEQGSALVQARYNSNVEYGVPLEDMGNFEFGLAIGLLVNTAPAAFWTLLTVFSNQQLLEEIRTDLSAIVKLDDTNTDPANPVRHVNITQAIDACPLLTSLFQETLRLQANVGSTRKVLKDTLLNNHYLLKANSLIQMPSKILHFDPTSWGPTAKDFNPRRFLRSSQTPKPPAGSFQTFGGGVSLCPGRHFATNEVIATLVMFVLQYDITPAQGETEWIIPTQEKVQFSTSIGPPDDDILVDIRRRKGFEAGTWRFSIGRVV